jgi:hypothetical protein
MQIPVGCMHCRVSDRVVLECLVQEGETASEAGSEHHDAEGAHGVAMAVEIEEGDRAAEGASLEEGEHGESEGRGGEGEEEGVEEGNGEPWDDIPVRK